MATPGYTIMPNELHKIVKKYTRIGPQKYIE